MNLTSDVRAYVDLVRPTPRTIPAAKIAAALLKLGYVWDGQLKDMAVVWETEIYSDRVVFSYWPTLENVPGGLKMQEALVKALVLCQTFYPRQRIIKKLLPNGEIACRFANEPAMV